jgi:hypothetical protein
MGAGAASTGDGSSASVSEIVDIIEFWLLYLVVLWMLETGAPLLMTRPGIDDPRCGLHSPRGLSAREVPLLPFF